MPPLLRVSGLLLVLVYVVSATHKTALRAGDVAVVVLSQADEHNAGLAQQLKADLLRQADSLYQKAPNIYLTHEDFPHPGAWTVVPLLPILQEKVGNNSVWLVFCEERTRINLQELISSLSQYKHSEEVWLGHGLQDKEPTIIHHFAFSDSSKQLQYPLLPAGFALSSALLKRLAKDASSMKKSDFSIDAMHELAVFIKTPFLSLPSAFCSMLGTSCATYPLPFTPCGDAVPKEDIYFAVKTCLKHHSDRVPVVKETWARDAAHIEFFSDMEDESIPTTAVGVVNTVRGHCAKTLNILNLAVDRFKVSPNFKWLVLADDDTLLSVPRLQSLLSCWSRGEQSVVVGERYGYNVMSSQGYNYPTGGGGLAVSAALLPALARHCHCPAPDSPDDMYLGFCLTQLNGTLVHSPFFHQARPADYAPGYLATQLPVSFHKHWMLDPVSTYNQWFTHERLPTHSHTEL